MTAVDGDLFSAFLESNRQGHGTRPVDRRTPREPGRGERRIAERGRYWRGQAFVIERTQLGWRAAALGVIGHVDVKLTRYRNKRGTVACLLPRDGGWRIVLDTTMDPEMASLSTYHELAHALQAQALGGWDELLKRQKDEMLRARLIGPNRRRFFIDRARERMPLELDAEYRAYMWHDQLPLAEARIAQ